MSVTFCHLPLGVISNHPNTYLLDSFHNLESEVPSPDASLAPLDASLAPHFKSLFWVGVTKPEELEKQVKLRLTTTSRAKKYLVKLVLIN